MLTDYPRDLAGYGRNPPQADWPGKARIAVQFVLNLEEGGETCVLHVEADLLAHGLDKFPGVVRFTHRRSRRR